MCHGSSCHLNCIPTIAWIPDARALLKHPRAGLELITKLQARAPQCAAAAAAVQCCAWSSAACRVRAVRQQWRECVPFGALCRVGAKLDWACRAFTNGSLHTPGWF